MMPDVNDCFLSDPGATTTLTLSWQRYLKNKKLADFIRYAQELTRSAQVKR
jgi:hypothetical protein